MPIYNFDWLAVHRVSRRDFRFSQGFDHWGDYFKSDRGGRAKVSFMGSGHVDILLGDPANWPVATKVIDEVISGDKTFEFDIPPGYMFEPRAYAGFAITMIETVGPLAFWSPVIGVGVGAPIGGVVAYLLREPLGPMVSEAVGAVLGGALGGGVGLLTGLGIIPVPQIPIPTFGATPEESGAPIRLGKYLITG